MEQFEFSSLRQEIYELMSGRIPTHVRVVGFHYEFVETPNGIVCACSLREGDGVWGDDLIEVTDEKLLEKLRSVKGQYFYGGFPVFYYDLVRGRTYDFYRGTMANILQWIEGCECFLVRGNKTCRGKVVHDPTDNEHWCIKLENVEPGRTFYRGATANVLQWIEGCEVSLGEVEDFGRRISARKTKNSGKVIHDPDNEHWCILLEYVEPGDRQVAPG